MFQSEHLIPIAMFVCVVFIVKIVSDNKTRRMMIEKGKTDENTKIMFNEYQKKQASSALKWGMVLVGLGLAVLLARLAPSYHRDEIIIALMFLLAGLGLLLFYHLTRRKPETTPEEKSLPESEPE